MKKIEEMDENAVKDLLYYPAQSWCRSFFDTVCKNMTVDNNFTELFNAWILDARYKAIIKMLDGIRMKVMEMLREHEDKVKSWTTDFSPYAMKLYKSYLRIAHKCVVHFNGDWGYEISEGPDKHSKHGLEAMQL